MKTSLMIQSKYLKKKDFPHPVILTIRGCAIEEVGRGEQGWVLYFNEMVKGLVLNATKIRQLEAGFGDDTDYWMGKKIRLFHDTTVMMGQAVVGGVGIQLPPGSPLPAATTQPVHQAHPAQPGYQPAAAAPPMRPPLGAPVAAAAPSQPRPDIANGGWPAAPGAAPLTAGHDDFGPLPTGAASTGVDSGIDPEIGW